MKFLIDAQASDSFVALLKSIADVMDWDIQTAHEQGVEKERSDGNVVGWAHAGKRVLITFDEFGGKTRAEVGRQIRDRGGKILMILGGPEQPPERALGRFLFHKDVWYPFLRDSEGIAKVSDLKQQCKLIPRSKMRAEARSTEERQFESYLEKRREDAIRPMHVRRKKAQVPREQLAMVAAELDLP